MKITNILKNRALAIKALFESFKYVILNRDKVSLYFFIENCLYFCFGTRFVKNRIALVLGLYNRGDYYDFKAIKLPKKDLIADNYLLRPIFLENIIFFVKGDKKTFFKKDHFYEDFGVEIESGDVVIDAGANIGTIAAYAASKGANVYAFEPIEECRKFLAETVKLNENLPGKIRIEPFALSDKTEKLEFSMDGSLLTSSSVIGYETHSENKQEMDAISLDEWAEKESIRKIDFIKADIEGAERKMLLGATRILREMKPKLAICTYHLPDDKEVLEKIVKDANPNYQIFHGKIIMYAK